MFAGHKISTLEELKQGGAKDIPVKDNPPPLCEVHEEPRKMYCFDCSGLICRDCALFNHAGHKSEFIKVAAPGTRQKLAERLLPLKGVQEKVSQAVEGVETRKKAIEEQGRHSAEHIQTSFQELHEIIERRKCELLQETAERVKEKLGNLTLQEKGFNMSLGTVQSLVDFVERTLENASDEEVVTIHGQILNRIEGVEKQEKGGADLEPVEEVDIRVEVSVTETLKDVCGRVFADPSKCTVEGESLQETKIDQSTKVSIRINTHQGTPTEHHHRIKGELKLLVDGSVVRVQGVHDRANTYTIEYTPKIRGRHELTVTVNGQPIAGSPFPVFVKIPPTKLGTPVREIDGVADPRYMTFNSSGNIVVLEWRGDIRVLDKGGKQLQNITRSRHGFKSLCGVAVDKDDNIYVTDSENKSLHKFNKEGALIKSLKKGGSGPGEFNFPRGVAAVGDQILVSDKNNHRVQWFNLELEQLGIIYESQGSLTQDVAIDNQDNIYICEQRNNRIAVLTSRGEFVRYIGAGNLSHPRGVCLNDEFVYVTHRKDNSVSIFRKDGQFISSYGIGILQRPYGLVIDDDGFVYVCDSVGSKIIVF